MTPVRQFVSVAWRRHRAGALACGALSLGVTVLATWALPTTWVVEAEVFVAEPSAVHRLANPFAAVPDARAELKELPETLRSRERLVSMVKRTGLLDHWESSRPAPLRLKDALLERLRGPVSEKDKLDALVAFLDKRFFVTVKGERVRVGVEWPSPEMARALVDASLWALLNQRVSREAVTLDKAAQDLDEQRAGVQAEMVVRRDRVQRAMLEGNWAAVEAESEQLGRDQARATELLVTAEEKHIAAEVFRRANALRFTVLKPPLPPLAPTGAGLFVRLVVALLAAALAALVGAALLTLASDRVVARWQLERETGLKVVASLRDPRNVVEPRPQAWAALAAGALAAATGAAVAVGKGSLLVALAPGLAAAAAWAVWTLPLKWPLLAVLVLGVTIDDPSDRPFFNLWRSPLYPLGKIFFSNIAAFTGFELTLGGLTVVMLARRLWFHRADAARLDPVAGQPPRPLQYAVLLSGAGIAAMVLWGLARGGDFREALWQFRSLLMMPVVAMLASWAFDVPRDLPKLLGVLAVGSVVKVVLTVYFMYGVAFPMGEYPPHATGHNDSMLFVVCVVSAVALFWEKPSRRHLLLLVLWVPFVFIALRLNDRRIAYVDLVMALGAIYLVSPWSPLKVSLTRKVMALVPVLLVYGAAGWTSKAKAFAPVAKVRSIIAPEQNSEEESSNVERDIENFNIRRSWEENMFLGQGFGHAFTEYLPSNDFAQSSFGHVGHNSILWLMWIGGLAGFTVTLLYLAVALYFLGRTLRVTRAWPERVGLLVSLAIIITYLMQAFGDMGTQGIVNDFFVGTALAIIGRLAARHGVWRRVGLDADAGPAAGPSQPALAGALTAPSR